MENPLKTIRSDSSLAQKLLFLVIRYFCTSCYFKSYDIFDKLYLQTDLRL